MPATADQTVFFSTLFARKSPAHHILVAVHEPGDGANVKVGPETSHFFASNAQQAADFASQYREGKHVFFGAAPRGVADRKKSAVSEVINLWCDIDLPPTQAEEQLKRLLLPPTVIVYSGRGAQAHWVLSKPCPSIEKAENVLRRLHLFLSGISETHNADRIMRVPDTQHVKDPNNPLPCRLTGCDPERVYSLEDIEAAISLPESYRNLAFTAEIKGKRSEKDFKLATKLYKLGMSERSIRSILTNSDHPISAKVFEAAAENKTNPAHYLDFTLSKVKARITLDQEDEQGGLFENRKDGLYYDGSRIATWKFTPTRMVAYHKGGWFVGVLEAGGKVWHDQKLEKRHFQNEDNLSAAFPYLECQATATKKQTKSLQTWLHKQAVELGVATSQGVEYVGRHGECFVSANQVLNADGIMPIHESEYLLVDAQGLENVFPHSKWFTPALDDLRDFLKKFHALFPKMNRSEVVWPLLGWYLAAPMKPQLKSITGGFPILNLFGTQGAGKTHLTQVMRRLLGIYALDEEGGDEDKGRSAGATNYANLRNLSASNALPIWLQEYTSGGQDTTRFNQRMKDLWDGAMDQRGRKDMGVDNYPLIAPLSLDGNDPLAPNVPAIQERTIRITLAKEWVARNSPHYGMDAKIGALPLETFAAPYLMFILENTHAIPQVYKQALTLCEETFDVHAVPDRMMKSMAMLTCALIMYSRFLMQKARIEFHITSVLLEQAFQPMLDNIIGSRGRVEQPVDLFAEALINEIALHQENRTNVPFTYKYDSINNAVWFSLPLAYKWWKTIRVKLHQDTIDETTLKRQLHERREAGEYVLAAKTVRVGSSTVSCHGLDLTKMGGMGFDIPNNLKDEKRASSLSTANYRIAEE